MRTLIQLKLNDNNRVVFYAEDYGNGIELIDKLYEEFSKVHDREVVK